MQKLLGIIIVLVSVALGLYLGFWLLFIGGIVQIINAIKLTPINALGIAIGIARVICSGFIGWLIAILGIATGITLLED